MAGLAVGVLLAIVLPGPAASQPATVAPDPSTAGADAGSVPVACPDRLEPFGDDEVDTAGSGETGSGPTGDGTPVDGAGPDTGVRTAAPLPAPTSETGGPRLVDSGLQFDGASGVPAPPVDRVTAWIVADLDTGAVVAACNAHIPLAPASTLKVLTALALFDRVPFDTPYVATEAAAGVDGSRAGLVPGLTYDGEDLWYGLLLGSGNDCAVALAELTGGPLAAADELNRTAGDLGALDTRAVNTSGLDAPGQVSSAYDLALLGRAALADPALGPILATTAYDLPGALIGEPDGTTVPPTPGVEGERATFQIQNHNRLLRNYDGATGVKNGWTSAAGGSFIGSAERDGRRYVVALLRADISTWRTSAALLDWAFTHGDELEPVGELVAGRPDTAAPTEASSGAGVIGDAGRGPVPGTGVTTPPTGGAVGPIGAAETSGLPGTTEIVALGGAGAAVAAGLLLLRRREP